MPAQKRPHESPPPEDEDDDDDDSPQQDQSYTDLAEDDDDDDESDGCPSSNGGVKSEFTVVKLAEVRKEVQCPICLGIIRKTRTVMECLHRFCRECIDKSMRLGNNECPACRTHCASRRSLRDDPNYDRIIAALYPDIDKYEEEELAFHEEEKARNKQIQASIAQTLRRQSEALGRKRTTARATAAAFVRRSQGTYRTLRGRRSRQAQELQESDDDDEGINVKDGGKDSSSDEEHCTEVKPKRSKRWGGARFSQPSSAAASADGCFEENDSEVNRESMGASVGLVGSSEILGWGKGGIRSNSRHGSLSGGNGKNGRNSRLSKLKDFLRNLEENNDALDIHLMLVSLDEQRLPSLQWPYLSCRPTLSVQHLRQYVAMRIPLQAEEIEIFVVEKLNSKHSPPSSSSVLNSMSSIQNPGNKLRVLDDQETLSGLQATCHFSQGHLLLGYQQKSSG